MKARVKRSSDGEVVGWQTILHVVALAIITHVLTGIRLAIGIIWIVLVPAEMLGVSNGLGYFILDTRDRLAYLRS